MRTFKQLSLEEREKLYGWQREEVPLREIARRLGRDHSCLSRELRRNRVNGDYLPCKAEAKAKKRNLAQRRKAPLKNSQIYLYVRVHLREGWSPEQIAGRLPLDHPGESIHPETIYRYAYHKRWGVRQEKLWQYLPLARKKRMKKEGRRVMRQSRIKGAVSIDLRPSEIERRQEIGHWESDNVIGKRSDASVLSTTVERLSRYILISKLPAKTAKAKQEAVVRRLHVFPHHVRKTITVDNGLENTLHQMIAQALHTKIYFTHPYHSWEKGTNENTNGRLRRFIPKGVSIDAIGEHTIQQIEERMNNTPRKCLHFKTPNEVIRRYLNDSV